MMQRQLFSFSDTGTQSDTGVPMSGAIRQMRWKLTSGDTGGNLEVGVYPTADSGDGFLIHNAGLAPDQVFMPVGFDTGTGAISPIVMCGDKLRAKRIATATGAIVGRLWIWVE